jgi:Protein of unknown function (DUF3293)
VLPSHKDFQWTSEHRLRQLAHGERPWRDYLDTVVHFDRPGLVGTVVPSDDGNGHAHPPLGPLHVITAIQPDSDPESSDSAARVRVLDGELRAAGLTAVPAVGSSVDGSHQEVSRAVFGLEDDAACALGRRFGQVAVFAWRGPRWSLLACASDRLVHRSWRWCGRF